MVGKVFRYPLAPMISVRMCWWRGRRGHERCAGHTRADSASKSASRDGRANKPTSAWSGHHAAGLIVPSARLADLPRPCRMCVLARSCLLRKLVLMMLMMQRPKREMNSINAFLSIQWNTQRAREIYVKFTSNCCEL